MSPKSKREYTAIVVSLYKKVTLKKRTVILNEYCRVTGYHRKHAIRKLNHFRIYTQPQPKSGRPCRYRPSVILEPLRKIWLAANLPCGKRLKPILTLWLPAYQKTYGHLSFETIKALTSISAATINRLFKPIRPQFKKKGHCTTKSGTLLRKHIPDRTFPGNIIFEAQLLPLNFPGEHLLMRRLAGVSPFFSVKYYRKMFRF